MLPLCRRVQCTLWILTSLYPFLARCLTLSIVTKQPYPGGSIQIESTTNSTDPSTANLYIYDTSSKQQTQLWSQWPATQSPNSKFTIPSTVSPGTTYVVQATNDDGKVLAASSTFQIFTASGTSSASGSTISQSNISSFSSNAASSASTTPGSTTPSPSATSSTSSNSSVPLGPIIGGVLGGLALIAIILALLLLLRRRQPAKPTAFSVDKAPPPDLFPSQNNKTTRNPTVSPFTLTTPPVLQRVPVADTKHSAPQMPMGTFPSDKKGLFSPNTPGPVSATSSSGFSSSDNLSKKRLLMESTNEPPTYR